MVLERLAILSLFAGFVFGAAGTPAAASPADDVMATIGRYAEAFNAGDAQAESALCASPASIVDDFPPHEWHGPNACADWAAAFAADAKAGGLTGTKVALGKPWHVDVTGDRAYVVVPTTFTYKERGEPKSESGIWTWALKKTPEGWRVTGWAWAAR